MTKRTLIGSIAAALVASFPVAIAQASPNDDQYGNPVAQETTPAVVETTPAVVETTPAVVETTPAVVETPSGGQETTPTVVKKPFGGTLPAATQQGSELPFTGLELGLIIAGGGAAAGAGLVLRRASRGRRS